MIYFTNNIMFDIILNVCRHLYIKDVVHMSMTCRYNNHNIMNNKMMWKYLIDRDTDRDSKYKSIEYYNINGYFINLDFDHAHKQILDTFNGDINEYSCSIKLLEINIIPYDWTPENISSIFLLWRGITHIDPSWDTGSIYFLMLNHNDIENLPINWEINRNLKVLNLSDNKIREIPANFNVGHINNLSMPNNEISHIDPNWDTGMMRLLDLSNNKIEYLSDDWHPENLNSILLQGNPVKHIPDHLKNIVKL